MTAPVPRGRARAAGPARSASGGQASAKIKMPEANPHGLKLFNQLQHAIKRIGNRAKLSQL